MGYFTILVLLMAAIVIGSTLYHGIGVPPLSFDGGVIGFIVIVAVFFLIKSLFRVRRR